MSADIARSAKWREVFTAMTTFATHRLLVVYKEGEYAVHCSPLTMVAACCEPLYIAPFSSRWEHKSVDIEHPESRQSQHSAPRPLTSAGA